MNAPRWFVLKKTPWPLPLSLVAVLAMGQAAKRTPVAMSTVSGRVFAITKGGDLKPARLAHVYLLYSGTLKGAENNTAASEFISALSSQMKYHSDAWRAWLHGMQQKYPGQDISEASDRELCRSQLLAYTSALKDTLDWVEQNKKPKQLLDTDADEEGNFAIRVPAGIYNLLAHGRAGINDAFWTSDVVAQSGRTTLVKLSSPEQSCVEEQ
jgi:hypothetical protein